MVNGVTRACAHMPYRLPECAGVRIFQSRMPMSMYLGSPSGSHCVSASGSRMSSTVGQYSVTQLARAMITNEMRNCVHAWIFAGFVILSSSHIEA